MTNTPTNPTALLAVLRDKPRGMGAAYMYAYTLCRTAADCIEALMEENHTLRQHCYTETAVSELMGELETLRAEYLEICGEDCGGEWSAGLLACPFYTEPEDSTPGGCRLREEAER